jgi:hypothetical protein
MKMDSTTDKTNSELPARMGLQPGGEWTPEMIEEISSLSATEPEFKRRLCTAHNAALAAAERAGFKRGVIYSEHLVKRINAAKVREAK